MSNLVIRPAELSDAAQILQFVRELATYEKQPEAVSATLTDIEQLFNDDSSTHALICTLDEQAIGFAVYFYNYSTWLGKHGLYLEDLYVSPQYRGVGAGKKILTHLAKLAVQRGCGRFEWSVIDWNQPAIDFYQSLGAQPQNEWIIYRLTGQALLDAANVDSAQENDSHG